MENGPAESIKETQRWTTFGCGELHEGSALGLAALEVASADGDRVHG